MTVYTSSNTIKKPRLVELESKIGGVLKLLLENCELVDRESFKRRRARGDSNARSPPCEGSYFSFPYYKPMLAPL